MLLFELFDNDVGQNPIKTANDELVQLDLKDTRKPQITLAKLNSLRKLRDYRKFLDLKHASLVSILYGDNKSDGGMGF